MRTIWFLLFALFLASCSSVTLHPSHASSRNSVETIGDFAPKAYLQDEENGTSIEERAFSKRELKHKLIHYRAHGALLPTTLAAQYLKQFYDSIAYHAIRTWPSIAHEQYLITITLGHLQLTMSSLSAPIPWALVANAAEHLSMMSNRALAETFDAFFDDVKASNQIAMSLRLLQNPAQAKPGVQKRLKGCSEGQRLGAKSHQTKSPRTLPSPSRTVLKVTQFKSITAMVPTVVAAALLEDFYSILAVKILTGEFASWRPDKTIIFNMWDFELSFTSDQVNIPLSFAQSFMIDMAEWSSREFTGLYEAIIEGDGALEGLMIYVKMRRVLGGS